MDAQQKSKTRYQTNLIKNSFGDALLDKQYLKNGKGP